MKKYISVTIAFICVLLLTACGNDKKLALPKPDNITEVEITESNSERKEKISDKKEISKLISAIENNSKTTNKESVNDQPTSVDNYITIKFHHKNTEENSSAFYIYKKKGNSYIEQPYSGIWELNEEDFNNISSYLTE